MANIRTIGFEIDPATWENGPPQALVAAADAREIQFNLDAALLFLGLVTRPPELHGFTLADSWAWLRYFPAFRPGNHLRLRPEWTRLDPHQKTVASDDYGVGFGTWVLRDLLGFRRYADTLFVVNVLERGQWLLRRQAKRGPSKSPDYLAYDRTGAVSVVECKGTQSSRAELLSAMRRGDRQKRGLTALGGQQIIHQLVVGAYVPQDQGSGRAVVAVHDPDKNDSRQELRKYTPDEIRRSGEQVSIAKELAIFDLSTAAATLVYDRHTPESLNAAISEDTARARQDGRLGANQISVRRDFRWAVPYDIDGRLFRGVRFRAALPTDRVASLMQRRVRRDIPEATLEDVFAEDWIEEPVDNGVELQSPIGATYRMEWLE
jgi:hypothetical protein